MADKTNVLIRIITKNNVQEPPIEGDVTWETERAGSPGKLTFTVPKTTGLSFQEGDKVEFRQYNPTTNNLDLVCVAYVFTKQRNADGLIKVTAYDCLRYLKNKYTCVYEDIKASEIVKKILKVAELPYEDKDIQETTYVISSLTEDEQTMFDIIQDGIDLTVANTTDLFVMYCNEKGSVCLKNIENLKTNLVITDSTAENFDYTSSIDENTYNEIYLYYDNEDTNKREEYIAKDNNNAKLWGRLKYSESIKTNANAKDKASKLLQLYNQKTRKLKVSGAFGDVKCRAGASVIVKLNLGDILVSNYMLIEKATHKFTNGEHTMDLTLSGIREFVA